MNPLSFLHGLAVKCGLWSTFILKGLVNLFSVCSVSLVNQEFFQDFFVFEVDGSLERMVLVESTECLQEFVDSFFWIGRFMQEAFEGIHILFVASVHIRSKSLTLAASCS